MWWKSKLDCESMSDAELRQVVPALKADADVLIAAVQGRALARGQGDLPVPPEVPVGCCGRGCVNCLWLFYYAEVQSWRDTVMHGWT